MYLNSTSSILGQIFSTISACAPPCDLSTIILQTSDLEFDFHKSVIYRIFQKFSSQNTSFAIHQYFCETEQVYLNKYVQMVSVSWSPAHHSGN